MALTLHNEVALINTTMTTGAFARRGKVLFGIVIAVDVADVDVIFENGQAVAAVPCTDAGPFDRILPIDGSALAGKVVYPRDSVASPEYRCIVERVYTRRTNDVGDTVQFALLKNLQNGEYFESLASALVVIPGQ